MESFKEIYAELQSQQAELKRKAQAAKSDAIAHVQEIITNFGIQRSDLRFNDQDEGVEKVTRSRAPVKYRLPNGVEWSGKGIMKKEVRKYLEENNLTQADLAQFLTEQFR